MGAEPVSTGVLSDTPDLDETGIDVTGVDPKGVGKATDLASLNQQVDSWRRLASDMARTYLKDKGLLK